MVLLAKTLQQKNEDYWCFLIVSYVAFVNFNKIYVEKIAINENNLSMNDVIITTWKLILCISSKRIITASLMPKFPGVKFTKPTNEPKKL